VAISEVIIGTSRVRRMSALGRHDDPYGMDAEIRVLIERAPEPAGCDCDVELTREAG
jgi:hypothetical protein